MDRDDLLALTDRVEQAIFRSYNIKAASDRAVEARKAAQWLSTYGHNCVGKDALSISLRLAYASGCAGAVEAGTVIEAAIIAMLPQIVEEAKGMVARDMEALLGLLPVHSNGGEG